MATWADLYNMSFNKTLSRGELQAAEEYLNTKYPGWSPDDLKAAINNMSESTQFDNKKPTTADLGAALRSVQVLSNIGHTDCQICGKEQFKTTRKKPYGWIPYQWGKEEWEVKMVPCICEKGVECLNRSYEVKYQHGITKLTQRAVNQIEQKKRNEGSPFPTVENKHGAVAFADVCDDEEPIL